ncbi:MAG: hypothetical protein NTU59_08440 [Coprothermobacterota bacterium]|nr:hypothetical protein [Coprothermobacterota bacterium]
MSEKKNNGKLAIGLSLGFLLIVAGLLLFLWKALERQLDILPFADER